MMTQHIQRALVVSFVFSVSESTALGSFLDEYTMPTPASVRALLRQTPTTAHLANRAFISVTGSQAPSFLHGILSTAVHAPAQPFYAALLHAQGRVLYDVIVHTPPPDALGVKPGQEGYLIEYDPTVPQANPEVPDLLSLLKKFVLRAKVKVRDASAEWDVWASWCPAAGRMPEVRHTHWARSGAGEPVWDMVAEEAEGSWPWGTAGNGLLRDRRAVGMGSRRVVRKGDRPQECSDHDLGSLGDYLLHRIAHGVPEGALDIQPGQAFPMESNLDLMGGVDFRKGCYVGQELTVRTYHTGLVRKRIMPVLLQPSGDTEALLPKQLASHLSIRAIPTAQHTTGAGRIPRPRGTGRLLSNTQGVGLALLRLEHVHGVATGDLSLEVESAVETGEKIGVTPWTPDGWPTMPDRDTWFIPDLIMSAFICEPPKPNEKSEVYRMLKLWDVDNGLVTACVEHISGNKDLQAEINQMEKTQADRPPSATKSQDFFRTIDILNLIMGIITVITSMSSDDSPALHGQDDLFKDPSLHMRLFTSYKDDFFGMFVLFDFPSRTSSGPLSAVPRASAKRALELGANHLRKRPSHDVSLGIVIVGMQFSVARIDRAGAAFSPMRNLKDKEGLEVLVRVVRSLKQEIWELPKED
ncbi:unnamed protein product [Peniophora sp. CBMAI 1063]|nr:unnamed protein product [Peniophora sp. CBMAI 1063]